MNDDSVSIVPASQKQTLGDRIRNITRQLRQEEGVQIKATSRILGAAAQLTQNHDRLIDEVVEMVEEDLDQTAKPSLLEPYTVEKLQQRFEKFSEAKAHFNLKARSWDALVDKLNNPIPSSPASKSPTAKSSTAKPSSSASQTPKRTTQENKAQDFIPQRLESIEQEIQMMRGDINRVVQLLELLVAKLP
ncbi:MAG: hypothetical protein WBA57_20570 [Elainellaceae cyanobacterium]